MFWLFHLLENPFFVTFEGYSTSHLQKFYKLHILVLLLHVKLRFIDDSLFAIHK